MWTVLAFVPVLPKPDLFLKVELRTVVGRSCGVMEGVRTSWAMRFPEET